MHLNKEKIVYFYVMRVAKAVLVQEKMSVQTANKECLLVIIILVSNVKEALIYSGGLLIVV